MSRLGIEPGSPGPMANTVPNRLMDRYNKMIMRIIPKTKETSDNSID